MSAGARPEPAGAAPPPAGAARVRRRHVDARRRDRRGATAGAVLRRLDDRLGEHDRDRPRRAVDRLLVRRADGRPASERARAVPRWCSSRRCCWRSCRSSPTRSCRVSVEAFDAYSVGAFAGSLFGVLVLVAVPVLMLGAVSPWAIRLSSSGSRTPGRPPGRMYAISTVGSLVGTFLAALLLIPLVGTQRTFLTFALALAIVAAVGLGRRWRARAARRRGAARAARRHGQGRRQRHASSTRPRRPTSTRASSTSPTASATSSSTRARPSTRSTARTPCSPATSGTATWSTPFAASGAPAAQRRDPRLRAAARPRARTRSYFPDTRIDGVEIDGELFDIGRKYFDLRERPQLREYAEDARPFLRRTNDALRRDLRRRLPPALHPVLPDHPRVLRARPRPPAPGRRGDRQRRAPRGLRRAREGADGDDEARSSRTWSRDPISRPTRCWSAPRRRSRADDLSRRGRDGPGELRADRAGRPRAGSRRGCGGGDVYTDDKAPVEWLIDKSIVEYAAGGDPRTDRAPAGRAERARAPAGAPRAAADADGPRGRRARGRRRRRGRCTSTRATATGAETLDPRRSTPRAARSAPPSPAPSPRVSTGCGSRTATTSAGSRPSRLGELPDCASVNVAEEGWLELASCSPSAACGSRSA